MLRSIPMSLLTTGVTHRRCGKRKLTWAVGMAPAGHPGEGSDVAGTYTWVGFQDEEIGYSTSA
jgi:hypothetical protein